MNRFDAGGMVFATPGLLGGVPGLLPDMRLARTGRRGMVVNVGHIEDHRGEELYLVSFETGPDGALAEPIGCLTEKLGHQPPA